MPDSAKPERPTAIRPKPVGARLLVKPVAPPEMAGSIHLPAQSRHQPPKGEVLDIGTKWEGKVCPFPIGTVVYYSPYAGFDITVGSLANAEELVIIKVEDIVAVEHPAEAPGR